MHENGNQLARPLIGVFSIVLTLLVITLAQHIRLSDHSLAENRQWTATKTTLAKHVFGAQAFFNGMQSLALGHLDLSAWHGFQEVVTVRPYPAEDVMFEFLLEPDAWLAFLWDRDQATYSGVRFSTNPLFHNMRFRASELDGFSDITPIEVSLSPNTWHLAEIRFAGDTVIIFIDKREIARFAGLPQNLRQIGFRGGLTRALVDNVSISSAGEISFTEDFRNRSDFVRPIIYGVLIVLAVNLAVFVAATALSRSQRSLTLHLLLMNFVLLVTAVLLYAYRFFGGSLYPIINPFMAEEESRWKIVEAERINEGIQERYSSFVSPEEHRILIIGTSQTWGAGAKRPEHTITNLFQDRLNAQGDPRFTVINAGISALESTQLLELYRTEWLDLGLDTVIINLSNNDADGPEFESNLVEMVRAGETRDIRTVLVLEPNALEWSDSRPDNYLMANHERMRRVAASNDLLIIDMQASLRDHHDDGFLWWDRVHLTSFGQSVFTNVLMEELAPTLMKGEENY